MSIVAAEPLQPGRWVIFQPPEDKRPRWARSLIGKRLLVLEGPGAVVDGMVTVWDAEDTEDAILPAAHLKPEITLNDAYLAVLEGFSAAREAHNAAMLSLVRSCRDSLTLAAESRGGWLVPYKDEYVGHPELREEIDRLLYAYGFDRP